MTAGKVAVGAALAVAGFLAGSAWQEHAHYDALEARMVNGCHRYAKEILGRASLRTLGGIGGVCLLTASCPLLASPYEDCILQNMKGTQDRLAAVEIRRACATKTTPVKCRDLQKYGNENKFDRTGARKAGYTDAEIDAVLRTRCIEECAASSSSDRRVDDCRTD